MGQEVGWRLRFSRARVLEVLVRPELAGALEEEAVVAGSWDLALAVEDGFVRGVFTRQGRGSS